MPAIFNAANEAAVELFLAGRIPFGRIAHIIERVLAGAEPHPAPSLETVLQDDGAARRRAREIACS